MTMGLDRPKRFYKTATVAETDNGYAVQLDGRGVRTPENTPVALPTQAAAQLLADEWAAQGEEVVIEAMTLNRISNFALDKEDDIRGEILTQIQQYLETDLLLYRADAPDTLVTRQADVWDPWVKWFNQTYDADLQPVTDLSVTPVPAAVTTNVITAVLAMSPFHRTATARLVGLLGSSILGLAVAQGALDADAAITAARVDEDHQNDTWGQDAEAQDALENLKGEIITLAGYIAALNTK